MNGDKDLGKGEGETSPLKPKDNFGSRPHLGAYILVDSDGNPWGPFAKATDAAIWATKKWPDQQEAVIDDEGEMVSKGWAVWALRHPDT